MTAYNYIFVGLLLLVAVGFALAPLIVVALVAPRKRSLAKSEIYECGVLTTGETWIRFRIQYYIYALMFVIFDIETVFLYPWAVSYGDLGKLGPFALVEMIVFLVILFIGLAYAWAKGVLRWVWARGSQSSPPGTGRSNRSGDGQVSVAAARGWDEDEGRGETPTVNVATAWTLPVVWAQA